MNALSLSEEAKVQHAVLSRRSWLSQHAVLCYLLPLSLSLSLKKLLCLRSSCLSLSPLLPLALASPLALSRLREPVALV